MTTIAYQTISAAWARKILKYTEIAKVNYRNNVTYVVNLISRSGLVLIRVWIFAQLYRATYAIAGTSEIGGLTVAMTVWSLAFTQSFQGATKPPVARLIDEEVKTGLVAYSMNRPYSYVLFHLFGFLGKSVPNILLNTCIGAGAALILVGPIRFTAQGLLLGSVLLFLGFVLDFFMSLNIGLAAFWIEDITPFVWIYQKSQTIFGGVILPIALFPDAIRRIAERLPFSQLFYSAARMVVHFDPALFKQYLVTQLVWITFFGIGAFWLFYRGTKHVSVNGG